MLNIFLVNIIIIVTIVAIIFIIISFSTPTERLSFGNYSAKRLMTRWAIKGLGYDKEISH